MSVCNVRPMILFAGAPFGTPMMSGLEFDEDVMILVASSVAMLQAILIAGLLFEHQRRRRAEITSRQHLATMAHLDRRVVMGELTASLAHENQSATQRDSSERGSRRDDAGRDGPRQNPRPSQSDPRPDIRKDDVRAGRITILRMRRLLQARVRLNRWI